MIPNTSPMRTVMSPAPVSIQKDSQIAIAVELMNSNGVRHLPVLDRDALVGIVSERDLAIVESLLPDGWESVAVAEAMTPAPYSVTPDTPVRDVARVMAQHKYGCAVVVDHDGKLVGLFTTIDALRLLAQ